MAGIAGLTKDIEAITLNVDATRSFFRNRIRDPFNRQKPINPKDFAELRKLINYRRAMMGTIAAHEKEFPQLKNIQQETALLINRIQQEEQYTQRLELAKGTDSVGFQITFQALDDLFAQDKQNATQLRQFVELIRGLDVINPAEFLVADFRLGPMACTSYQHRVHANPTKAVIIVPGLSEARASYGRMAAVIAKEGYHVVTMDFPSQGDSIGKDVHYSAGIASEWVNRLVEDLRGKGATKVGFVGHSHGAFAGMFAAGGYSFQAERDIFIHYDRYLSVAKELEQLYESIDAHKAAFNDTEIAALSEKAWSMDRELGQAYENIEKTLLNSIMRSGVLSGRGRIDALVALSPPLTTQAAIKDTEMILKLVKRKWVPRQLVGGALSGLTALGKKTDRNVFPGPGMFKKMDTQFSITHLPSVEGAMKLGATVVYDKTQFATYLLEMKNPKDYFSMLDYFSWPDRALKRPPSDVIRSFVRDYLQKIPKLFIYGTADQFLARNSATEIEAIYRMCGNAEIKKGNVDIKAYEGLTHSLSAGRTRANDAFSSVGMSGPVLNDITQFLKRHL